MAKFHINGKGVPSACRATKGNCPFGDADSHFSNKEEAQKVADRQNESSHSILPNVQIPQKEKTRNTFIGELEEKGFVSIGDGKFYKISLLTKDNFPDMPEKLEQQLKDENLYENSYIGYISEDLDKGSVQMLPIYGHKHKYETKWFKRTADEAIKTDLRAKGMGLLNRYLNE